MIESMTVGSEKVEIIKCDSCKCEIKSPEECISAGGGCICETCYRNMLSPHMKINFND